MRSSALLKRRLRVNVRGQARLDARVRDAPRRAPGRVLFGEGVGARISRAGHFARADTFGGVALSLAQPSREHVRCHLLNP